MDLLYISQAYRQLVSLPSIPIDFTAIRFDTSGKMYTKTIDTEIAIVGESLTQTLSNKTVLSLNAGNTKISNLLDGTLSTDAITLNQLNNYVPNVFAGTVTQPTVTNHGSGLIDISSCTVNLFSNANNIGQCKLYSVPQLNGIQLVAGTYYYVSVIYNNGNPIYDIITDNTLINHSDRLNVLQIQWENTGSHNDVYVFSTGNYGLGLANKIGHRLIHTQRFGYESGFALTVDSSLHLILTGGYLWYDGEELSMINSIDTNNTTFWHYYKSSGSWATTARNTLNNTQYNNGTNLVNVSNNKYCVAWIYRSVVDDDIYVLSGEGDYTLAQAQASGEPVKPNFISKMSYLIGKVLIQKGTTTSTYIPLLTAFSQSSSAIEWGNISGTLTNQFDLSNALNLKVAGPTSATNNAITLFDGTTGKMVKNSTVTIDQYGIMRFTSASAILVNTTQGSDNASFVVSSTGSGDSTRGAYIMMLGNQYSGAEGDLQLYAGDSGVSGKGAIRMMTNGAERFVLSATGAIKFNNAYTFPTGNSTGVLTNDGAGNLTWTPATGGMTNPMTTLGDIIYGGASGTATRLAGNLNNSAYFLTSRASGGVATAPTWTSATGTGSVVLATSPIISGPTIDDIKASSSSANPDLWSETTTGAITIGASLTSGTITIGNTGAQTGNFNLATGTGALAINIGTGGTGIKTISIGTSAIANLIYIGNLGNSRIGNTTSAPLTELHIATERTQVPRGIMSTQHSSGISGASVMFRKSRNTFASPAVIVTGDNLGRFTAGGYDGTTYVDDMATIEFQSTGTIGTGRIPTQIIFSTGTDTTTSVLTNAIIITSNQLMNYATDVSANFVDLSVVNKGWVSANYQPLATNLTSLAGLSYVSPSFVKMTGANTFTLDTTTYVPTTRSLTINGTTYDLSSDRSWTITTSSETSVAQTGHGFRVGNAIYSTGNNTYAKCQANSVVTSEFVGIVTTVSDLNNFKFSSPGSIITLGVPAVVGGTVMYLDPSTAGALTSTEPSTIGQVSKPVMIVLNNGALAEILNMRGVLVSAASVIPLVASNNLSDVANRQTALNTLTAVSAATNEYVLTKDTATGNAIWKVASSGMTNPMTTLGDIIYGGASGVTTRLAGNATTTPFVLTSTGSGSATAPVWTTTANSANSVMMRDSNVNVSLNNAVLGYTTTATASQTTTLTISSSRQQFFTGTTAGQIVQMPVTSTLVAGFEYLIVNTSNKTITINSSGSNLIGTLAAGGSARLVCVNTGVTTAAGWYFSVASYNSIIPTWDIALNTNLSIYMGSGSNTTWYAYGTLFTPRETTSVSLNSTMKWIMTSASSGYFIMAVYKYVNGGSQTLMFKSSATALGGTAGHLSATISSITDGTLVAGTWYYMVIIQNQNGPSGAGVSLSGSSTIKPYRNWTQSLGNLGTDGAGSAPSTITEPSGESTNGTPWVQLTI